MIRLPQKLIKFGFFLLYNHLAFTYDLVAWLVSFGQWADWRRTAIPYLQPGPTLELACGTGELYIDLTLANMRPVGLDLSPYMARLTAKKLRRRNLVSRIIQSRAQELPFPDAYFTNIVATFPSNYIFEEKTLSEINRVLAPTSPARLIIVMQGQLKNFPWLTALIEWLYQITGQREALTSEPLSILRQAGFEARWETGSFKSATATLIIAHKVRRV